VDTGENRVREEARQRDHRQLYELLADFLEEVRRSGRSVVPEPLALLSAPQENQVSPTHIFCASDSNVFQDSPQVVIAEAEGDANPVVISPRHRSTDRKRSKLLSKNNTDPPPKP
jgi:hypothetical protein